MAIFSNALRAEDVVTEPIRTFGLGLLYRAAYSPDGQHIATCGGGGAFLWDVNTCEVVCTLSGHTSTVLSIAFSPDGTQVLTGSRDKTAKLWDTTTGECIRTFAGHTSYVTCVAFSSDATKVLTGSSDYTAKLWDAATGDCICTFTGHTCEIKRAVAEKYSQVAENPDAEFNFPVGRQFAESVGYPAELLDKLPSTFSESFTGAGNPQPYVCPQSGETVLDLGCGAGLDLYLYAKAVGETGKLYGLDLSKSMIDRAAANLESAGIGNVELLNASADSVPLPDESVNLVTSNGIYNLAPDKDAVMREAYRVLKAGGRTVFAEIVLKAPLPEEIRKNMSDWFRCIGGALPKTQFLSRMQAVGFGDVEVLWEGRNDRTGHPLALCVVIRARK
ncbi:MAG TPA: methyltransferase domain-containing protein [Planctomycetota bacterium]|nr:methyltransferase domain-containing protein [Planctomycetota bacterium]